MRRRAILVSALLALFLIPVLAQAESIPTDWVVTYDGLGASSDTKIVVDSSGNAYVAGGNELIKHNIDGSVINDDNWPIVHNLSGMDEALMLDENENICVGGVQSKPYTTDFYAIKYASDGRVLFSATYNGPDDKNDRITDIHCDSSDNFYVTGAGLNSNGDSDFVTIKYAADGATLVRPYDLGGNEKPEALTVDSSGNVYVTGTSSTSGRITIKYDPNMNLLWEAPADDGYSGSGYDIEVSPLEDFVYVAVVDYEPNPIVAIKYNVTDGTRVAHADSTTLQSGPIELALDSVGNVYVAGLYPGGGDQQLVLKYDGNLDPVPLCEQQLSGIAPFVYIVGIEIDAADNLYVGAGLAGDKDAEGNFVPWGQGEYDEDYWAAKYDSTCTMKWGGQIDTTLGYWEWPSAIAVDPSANVYMTGGIWDGRYGMNGVFLTLKVSQGPSTIPDLITLVEEMRADGRIYNIGFATTLVSMLTNAQASLDAGNNGAAANALNAAINHIQGGSGMMIDPAAATELIGYINQIIAGIQV